MDRFVVREPRVGAEYPQAPQSNRLMTFSSNSAVHANNLIPDTMYFGGYGAEIPMQRGPGFMAMTHMNSPFTNAVGHQEQISSGIDPRYLAAYTDNNAAFIAGQRQQMRDQIAITNAYNNGSVFTSNYENRSFSGAERNKPKAFTPQIISRPDSTTHREEQQKIEFSTNSSRNSFTQQQNRQLPTISALPPAKSSAKDTEAVKGESQFPIKTRTDKLRDLQKCGTRVFSGPVEKVLKWHKALQDLGLMVLYEVVAKCVSVRPTENCAKTLVIRDDNGPAMQVVYFEIDFLLPELKPPCTIRVIGRMMPGTCRLQAFSVRGASGDDVAAQSRRAAVAAHHVAKISKELH